MRELYLVWYEEDLLILNLIGKLKYDGKIYQFEYLNYETNELQLFSKNGLFYGFDDLNKIYISNELFPSICSRIPSPRRVDYDKILEEQGLKKDSSKFEILLKTKGKISSDNFLFITKEEYDTIKHDLNSK